MELDDTERPQGTSPLRRFHTRIVVAAVAAAVAATIAAGLAFAETRPAPIGNGIVVIDTGLAYQNGQAAGTGMVLTSSGVVLTNNHVIRNATTIKIVVPSTGRSYSASVVGYDATDDVAVLQATDASNLKTVSLGNSADVSNGQSVTAVGNAGGTGSLTHASGKVTDVNRAITVSDDQGGSENLSGLIETNASVQPGDSGGPLLNAAGQVIGMDTAASTSQGYGFDQTTTSDGYAIPINKALPIALRIESGNASSTIHIGSTPFLGVEVTPSDYGNSGAAISSVVSGSPADHAGLVPGDLITSVDGHAVSSPTGLTTIISAEKSGASVSVTYVDQSGATQTANVTLGSGPPR